MPDIKLPPSLDPPTHHHDAPPKLHHPLTVLALLVHAFFWLIFNGIVLLMKLVAHDIADAGAGAVLDLDVGQVEDLERLDRVMEGVRALHAKWSKIE